MVAWHLVCRDCEFEELKANETTASTAKFAHETDHDHRVKVAEVNES